MAYVGTGSSSASLIDVAVDAALHGAMAKMGKEPIAFALVFAGPERSLESAMRTLEARLPKVPMMGCSTAGEFTELGMTKHAITLMLVGGSDIFARGHGVPYSTLDVDQTGALLSVEFAELARQENLKGRKHSTTFTLVDGISGLGERVVESLRKATRSFQPIVGGAAGDNAKFASTPVAFGTRVMMQGAAALHVFTEQPIGIGLGTGLVADSPRMTVTKATGNIVHEIDRRPAFEVYQEYAKKRGIDLYASEASRFLLEHDNVDRPGDNVDRPGDNVDRPGDNVDRPGDNVDRHTQMGALHNQRAAHPCSPEKDSLDRASLSSPIAHVGRSARRGGRGHHEGRHSPQVHGSHDHLRMRASVEDGIDEGLVQRRRVFELPPLLHRQAAHARHGRPRGALPQEVRERRQEVTFSAQAETTRTRPAFRGGFSISVGSEALEATARVAPDPAHVPQSPGARRRSGVSSDACGSESHAGHVHSPQTQS
jgi:hypothetical protein